MHYINKKWKNRKRVGDEIRNGDLNKYLLKPLSHLGFSGAMVAAEKVGTLLFALIIFPFFVFFTTYQIQIAGTIWGMLILLTAIICKFFISMAISYLAFWYEETWTFHIILDISMVFVWCYVAIINVTCLDTTNFKSPSFSIFWIYSRSIGKRYNLNIPCTTLSIHEYSLVHNFWMITKSIWFLGMRKYGAFGG